MSTDKYLNKIVLNKMTREQFENLTVKKPDEFYAVTDNTILGSISIFDTVIKDHILTYEESKGLALQGTYVYKEALAGSRYGYYDFYNKCLGEYNEATETETVNGVAIKVSANGHKFFDIADKVSIDGFFNTMGSAWFYGIDTENERIFLPRDKYFAVKGKVAVAGNGMTLGLTNGTNDYGVRRISNNSGLAAGNYSNSLLPYTSSDGPDGLSAHTYLGVNADPEKSGIEGKLTSNTDKYLYICVGNTVSQSTVTNVIDVTTTENDTFPLFTGMYFDFTPNNVSWVKGGRTVSGEHEYIFTYNELVNILNGDTRYGNLKVINESEMITGLDYSEYWKVNQDDMTFTTPTAISNKVYSDIAPVIGNGMSLGLTNGTDNGSLTGSTNSGATLLVDKNYFGAKPQDDIRTINGTSGTFGVTTDPTKSGIEAHLQQNSTAQLYFKVANAVQNLELLDVGQVMENAVLRSSLTEAQVVIETYVNGTSWYRIWSDGFCEQGGTCANSVSAVTVTLLKHYKDTNYSVFALSRDVNNTAIATIACTPTTNSTFTYINSASDTVLNNWRTCGYIY